MLNNIVIGKYLPGDSVIHRLNPIAKIISLIILLVGVFMIKDIYGYLVSYVFIFTLIIISKVSIKLILNQMKIIMFMLIFLAILNIFIIQEGNVLITIYKIKIYDQALYQSVIIFARLSSMIFISSLLTLTTKPMDLTFGIEQLLLPLKKLKFPSHEVAMMISIALRFIPTLIEETNKIMIAQTSRGVDFQSKHLKEKITAIVSLLIPLFVSSFKRAEDLANAMEARGYNPSAVRTRYVVSKWHNIDTISLIIAFIYTGLIICYTIIS